MQTSARTYWPHTDDYVQMFVECLARIQNVTLGGPISIMKSTKKNIPKLTPLECHLCQIFPSTYIGGCQLETFGEFSS